MVRNDYLWVDVLSDLGQIKCFAVNQEHINAGAHDENIHPRGKVWHGEEAGRMHDCYAVGEGHVCVIEHICFWPRRCLAIHTAVDPVIASGELFIVAADMEHVCFGVFTMKP